MKLFFTFIVTCTYIFASVFDFNTISSDFKQTITNEENSKISYEGKLYATTSSKALWIYKNPIEKKIYFNQDQVIIIEPELEQAIITNLQNVPNLTEILKSGRKISDNIYNTQYDDLNYVIYVDHNQIKSISYKDKLGNRVKITLFNQIIDSFLDDTLFEPTIPKDFDIVTQ